MIRSLLFVPGDSPRKFASALRTTADALILDLEDSVALPQKAQARQETLAMLRAPEAQAARKALFVRVNALDTGLTLQDLAAVMPAAPFGIVLPKCSGGHDVTTLSHYLDAFEAAAGHSAGQTRILGIATETAASLFGLGSYARVSPRLWGLMWGGEDLQASLGSTTNQVQGTWTDPYRVARSLCLAGAAAAGVEAIDTVATDIRNLEAVSNEASAARRDGFTGKAVIHPSHVEPVNLAFTPTADEVTWAERVVRAFTEQPDAGVVQMDGKMVDKPHLRAAQRILSSKH
jgi:citrate lyase subunit beta/citryl-CoA lyase